MTCDAFARPAGEEAFLKLKLSKKFSPQVYLLRHARRSSFRNTVEFSSAPWVKLGAAFMLFINAYMHYSFYLYWKTARLC